MHHLYLMQSVFSEDDAIITRDEVYQSLIEPVDPLQDTYTQIALEFCCGAMLIHSGPSRERPSAR
ncbi:hypothetical protein DPMN_112552 [Dreissena polymorpha]|uniref:Uncharacterized protein n=1 Tax=Dreissena polymorpha TaxID=45954 RepID=A0A9D4QPZ8_DREPO|nr:hypothetical protein DPMN_112552 [Dreissena polymorpha]